jgi:GT2 family glycosyltransferase
MRRGVDRLESTRKVHWPPTLGDERNKVAIVTVNYNTVELIRHLMHSLFRSGTARKASTIVVVDNGSDDGSRDYLDALAQRGLIVLLHNRWPPYHGPALNRAFSFLAAAPGAREIDRVWILDSDTMVLRDDTMEASLTAARMSKAAHRARIRTCVCTAVQ